MFFAARLSRNLTLILFEKRHEFLVGDFEADADVGQQLLPRRASAVREGAVALLCHLVQDHLSQDLELKKKTHTREELLSLGSLKKR